MRHWSARWIGTAYVAGEYECVDLVREVLADRFDLLVDLPRPRRDASARDLERLLRARIADYARPLERAPTEGDGVLMRRAGARRIGCHIGIWCRPDGLPGVLHCLSPIGAVLHELAGLPACGLEVEGVYGWL